MALLHLSNGAASVPSSILGVFLPAGSPVVSTDYRRKDVRARAADATSGTARWRRKATYTEQPDGIWVHNRSLESSISSPPTRSYRDFSTSSGAFSTSTGILSQGRIAA